MNILKRAYRKERPIVNDPLPVLSHDQFDKIYEGNKDRLMANIAKRMTGKRKKSTTNRLTQMKRMDLKKLCVAIKFLQPKGG